MCRFDVDPGGGEGGINEISAISAHNAAWYAAKMSDW